DAVCEPHRRGALGRQGERHALRPTAVRSSAGIPGRRHRSVQDLVRQRDDRRQLLSRSGCGRLGAGGWRAWPPEDIAAHKVTKPARFERGPPREDSATSSSSSLGLPYWEKVSRQIRSAATSTGAELPRESAELLELLAGAMLPSFG